MYKQSSNHSSLRFSNLRMLRAKDRSRLGIILICAALASNMMYVFLPDEGEGLRSLNVARELQVVSDNTQLAAPIEEACWRKCPQGRMNRIFYTGDVGGLTDRKGVIHDLAELAGYLCAQLILPKPARLLHPLHNNGILLDPYMQWEDVYNVTFADDNTTVIRKGEFVVNEVYFYTTAGYERVVSNGGNWKKDFEKVQEISWAQTMGNTTGFVWEMPEAGYFVNDLTRQTLPPLHDDMKNALGNLYNPPVMAPKLKMEREPPVGVCQYTNSRLAAVPSQVMMIKDILSERIKQLSSGSTSIGVMHLRRTDAINDCDTSVARIKQFLSCSLKDTEQKGNMTLMLRSDEQDGVYRQDITNLQKDFDHLIMLDMDALIHQIVDENVESGRLHPMFKNNYFLFDVGTEMRDFDFSLVRRRMICDDCTAVAALI